MADAQKWLTETAFVVPGTKAKVPRWAVGVAAGGLIVLLLLSKRATGLFSEPGEEQEEKEVLGGVFEELPELPASIEALLDSLPGEYRSPEETGEFSPVYARPEAEIVSMSPPPLVWFAPYPEQEPTSTPEPKTSTTFKTTEPAPKTSTTFKTATNTSSTFEKSKTAAPSPTVYPQVQAI